MKEEIKLPTHGAQVIYDKVELMELLGLNGDLNNIVFAKEEGKIGIVVTGNDKEYPALNATNGSVDVCSKSYLRVVSPDKVVRIRDSHGKEYVHKRNLIYVKNKEVSSSEE